MSAANLLLRIQTVISNGPDSDSVVLCNQTAGPILDYNGIARAVQIKLMEVSNLLGVSNADGPGYGGTGGLIGDTDPSGDSDNWNLLAAVWLAFKVDEMNQSDNLIPSMKTVISNGPQGLTPINATNSGGEIMDYVANCYQVLTKLQEAAILLGGQGPKAVFGPTPGLYDVTDNSDPNHVEIEIMISNIIGEEV